MVEWLLPKQQTRVRFPVSAPKDVLYYPHMKNVTIYSTPNCTYCKMTKDFLNEHKVAFTEHDVAADAAQRAKMIEASEQMGVPVTIIDDSVVIGFDKDALVELLGLKA